MGPKSAKMNLAYLVGPLFLAIPVAIDVRLIFVIFYLIGFFLFLNAKMSIVKQGTKYSFGAREMSGSMKKSYYWGYAIMICTAAFNIAAYLKTNP